MFKMLKNRKGFTLVELMVVAIIVAILAAVLIPMMTGNKMRAYGTEAEASLGTIRNALRVIYAENNTYPAYAAVTAVVGNITGISARTATVSGDLDGTFFSQECYTITSTATTYTIKCTWNLSVDDNTGVAGVPKADKVNGTTNTTTLDNFGTFVRTGY